MDTTEIQGSIFDNDEPEKPERDGEGARLIERGKREYAKLWDISKIGHAFNNKRTVGVGIFKQFMRTGNIINWELELTFAFLGHLCEQYERGKLKIKTNYFEQHEGELRKMYRRVRREFPADALPVTVSKQNSRRTFQGYIYVVPPPKGIAWPESLKPRKNKDGSIWTDSLGRNEICCAHLAFTLAFIGFKTDFTSYSRLKDKAEAEAAQPKLF